MKRIFVMGISQESNSFNPLKSTYGDFAITKGEAFRSMPALRVLIDAGYEVVESVFARAVPGGALKLEDFMKLADEMLAPLVADRQGFDGVFLPMHGALDVEYIGSGEAYLVAKVREYVGPGVPISVALDMHANIKYSMAKNCNIIYGFRTAPHIDVQETHIRAAQLLDRAIREGVLPQTRLLRIPVVMPGENFMTASGLGKDVIEMLPALEEAPGVWCSSYFVGMTWVDCPQNGAAVVVSGLGDLDAGMKGAKGIADFVWEHKDDFTYQGTALDPVPGVEFVKTHQGDGLVMVSDSADNITAGGAGDNAQVLSLFLEHRIRNALFCSIIDPIAVAKCQEGAVGDVLDLTIGGAFDPQSTQVSLKGARIKALTKWDAGSSVLNLADDKPDSAVLEYEGIHILLFNKRKPCFSEETLKEHGLTRHDYEVLVVKQGYLEPEFNEAASHQTLLYTTGNVDQRVWRLPFKKLRRPMYPIDPAGAITPDRLFEIS